MEYLVSAEEMRRADHCVIEEYGVPSLVLMERAALASVELMEREGFNLSRVLVVSGSGNNGGDGFAMARILYLKGIEAELWFVGNPDHLSKEAALQKKICENYGMKFVRNLPAGEYTTIVDAVFGSGLSREVKGSYRRSSRASTAIRRRFLLWISLRGFPPMTVASREQPSGRL